MSSFSESEPVFASRCLKVGLSEADIAKLKEQGINNPREGSILLLLHAWVWR